MSDRIIPMEQAHLDAVSELEKQCFSDPWPREALASELENPLSLWLVAVSHCRIIGYVGSQTVMDSSDMMNLAVAPDRRRAGVARALVGELCRLLKERDCRELLLEVRASNTAAISLYESLAFSTVGRRKNYYFHPTEDALILRKELV